MTSKNTKDAELVHVKPVEEDDDAALRALGYVPSFKREFSNISTVRRYLDRGSNICRLTELAYRIDFLRF
jgi:hypothetical protein